MDRHSVRRLYDFRRLMRKITRKEFLKISTVSVTGLMISSPLFAALKFISEVDNPLEFYPDRDWEKIYRDQYKYDDVFHFLCAPDPSRTA